jgi:regulator of protease activity HflC (stomatin/prohibitin superfamily)
MQSVIDFLLGIIKHVTPIWIVNPWDGGVHAIGKWWWKVGPGIHFKLPFLSQIATVNVKRQTVRTFEQVIRTLDGYEVVCQAVITYAIRYAHKVFIEVQDWDSALVERAMVFQAQFIASHRLEELTVDTMGASIKPQIRQEGFRWGCEVEDYGVVELARVRVLRLHGVAMQVVTG